MNTYNENLQNTVINTLNGIYLQQQNLASAQTTAEYTLYHAQGAEITARDKLELTEAQITQWQNINNQAVINNNQMTNLLTTATDIGKLAASSNTNVATAAANVQIASNAISLLASDIGAALNVATASLFDTDVYNRIVQANNFINNVANDSRNIARKAMDTSANTSEIISTEVLALAKASAAKVANVLKSTQPTLNRFSNLAISESADVSAATATERQAEGALSDADSALTAIDSAYTQANNQLNLGLTITVLSGFEIQASFQALSDPLPTFTAPPASTIVIPSATPAYYLALVPAQNASIFSIDQATQLFQQSSGAGSATSGFLAVTPDLPDSPSYVNAVILLTKDAYGQPVQPGQSYVAYIYTELSLPYKQFINNFSDLLSAPSQPFTPATRLPGVQNVRMLAAPNPDSDGVTWSSLQFQAVPLALSADEAAQAAAADAARADAANAAAQTAADQAAAAAQNISASAGAAATALLAVQTSATTAASDAATEDSAAKAAQAAQDQTTTAGNVAAAGMAASVAAAVANSAANDANTAFQNLLAARDAVASASATPTPATATSAGDSSSKGKGKPGASAADKSPTDPASLAKAQQAAAALASATEALSPAVANAENAASDAAIAANNAAIVVTLLDPDKAPVSDPAVLELAIALAVAAAANAAASTAAAANAAAAQASAAAAAASANGTMSASDANSAALAATSAAQVSNTAANAAAGANANVVVAQENLSAVQIEKAAQALVAAANIVAPAAAAPSNTVSASISAAVVAPALASAMVASATQATGAASAASNAVAVCNSTLPALEASAELALNAAAGDGASVPAASGQAATQQDYDNLGTAIAAVVTACAPVAASSSANATSAASAADSANSAAASAVAAAATAAATAAASAAAAATAAANATSASAAATNAITQADVAAQQASQASAVASAASAAAQASAALAAQAAAAPPASPGTILAANAAVRARPGYRCILVQVSGEPDLDFMVSPDGGSQTPIYFNLNIAEQVAAANYVTATQVAITTAPTSSSAGFGNPIWEVTLDGSVTDNFGNPIRPGVRYQPFILTVSGAAEGANASEFVNTLTTNIPAGVIGTASSAATPQ